MLDQNRFAGDRLPWQSTPPRHLTDEQLVRLTGEGISQAFELLVERHHRRLLRYCATMVGAGEADEAVQETLLRAYLALRRGEHVRHVTPWLSTIARNVALNLIRARAMRPVIAAEPAEPAGGHIDPLERLEDLRTAVEAIASLPARQREALVLRELEGLSYAEIQSRLCTSQGAVRQLLRRARATLRGSCGLITWLAPWRWLGEGASLGGGAAPAGPLSACSGVALKVCAAALVPAALGTASVVGASRPAHPRGQASVHRSSINRPARVSVRPLPHLAGERLGASATASAVSWTTTANPPVSHRSGGGPGERTPGPARHERSAQDGWAVARRRPSPPGRTISAGSATDGRPRSPGPGQPAGGQMASVRQGAGPASARRTGPPGQGGAGPDGGWPAAPAPTVTSPGGRPEVASRPEQNAAAPGPAPGPGGSGPA